jgi:hypothetical protein
MDHASGDCTQIYADTFVYTPDTYDTGVYTLDDSERANERWCDDRARVPIRRYKRNECNPVRSGGPVRCGEVREGFRGKETYWTGKTAVNAVDRERKNAIFDGDYDERPLHYAPLAGEDWAHLIPRQSQRPLGGACTTSLAFPANLEDEKEVMRLRAEDPRLREGFQSQQPSQPQIPSISEIHLQYIKIFLLIVIVVMMAMTLAISFKMVAGTQRSLKKAIKLLGQRAASQVSLVAQ